MNNPCHLSDTFNCIFIQKNWNSCPHSHGVCGDRNSYLILWFCFYNPSPNTITTLLPVVVWKQIGIVQNTDIWFVSLCHWFTDYWLRLLPFCPTLLLACSWGTGHLSLIRQNIITIIMIFTIITIITIIMTTIIIWIGFAEHICPVFQPD